ncbi:MAG TPA: carbon storage regulator [Acidimicrobiales bacterium]|nr:carbon storage regulator [Acidimicrobiales bacterium]
MLVLRRRPNEAIVIDGGLTLTLLQVTGGVAWLCFTTATTPGRVEVAVPANALKAAELSFRGVRALSRRGPLTTLELTADGEPELEAVVTLTRRPGEAIEVAGLNFSLTSIEKERLYLELTAQGLGAPITLSIVDVSSVDARIGVSAPPEIRVNRAELWEQMQAANAAAAGEWSAEDLAALTTEKP